MRLRLRVKKGTKYRQGEQLSKFGCAVNFCATVKSFKTAVDLSCLARSLHSSISDGPYLKTRRELEENMEHRLILSWFLKPEALAHFQSLPWYPFFNAHYSKNRPSFSGSWSQGRDPERSGEHKGVVLSITGAQAPQKV